MPWRRIDRPQETTVSDTRSTPQRLLDAALEVYLERGWQGASLVAVAARAGLTTGAIYSHFKGKNELFVAVCEDQFRRMSVEIGLRLAGDLTNAERLDILRAWFRERHKRAGVRLIYDLWHQAAEYPRVRKALADSYRRATDDVARMVTLHMRPELEPGLAALGLTPETLAIIGTALMEGLLLRQFLTQSDESVDLVFGLLTRLVLPLAGR